MTKGLFITLEIKYWVRFIYLFLSLVLAEQVSAICPVIHPSEARAQIITTVNVTRAADQFIYTYALANDRTSERAIGSWGLATIGSHVISSTPHGWTYMGTKVTGGPNWASIGPSSHDLVPGQNIHGFSIASVYPPQIVGLFAWSILTDDDEIPDAEIAESLECENDDTFQLSADPLHNSVHAKTLVPAKISVDITAICDTFIRDLIGQVRAASELGWIKHDLRKDRDDDDDHGKRKGDEKGKKKGHDKDDDADEGDNDDVKMDAADKNLPGVAKSIIQKLTKVRRECMRGELSGAREKLQALIKQTDAQRGKHLTDEAYYLIKFNAEFLLEKL